MGRAVDVVEVRSELLTREAVIRRGWTDGQLREAIRSGHFRRVRRGWYMAGDAWGEYWPEFRHLAEVLAAAHGMESADSVFSHASAAVLWGLPLYNWTPREVHVTRRGTGHSVRRPGIMRHSDRLSASDVVRRHGVPCTSLERTVFDIARTGSAEAALTCLDAALRMRAMRGHVYDEPIAAAWHEGMRVRAADATGARGIRQARWLTEIADGRAQLPGESVSRLQLIRLGFRSIRLQVPVAAPDGGNYWIDFALDDVAAFGEFDGMGKYLDESLRGERTPQDVLRAEKQREDWIRGTQQRRLVRWGSDDIVSPEALAARLRAFGIHPPR